MTPAAIRIGRLRATRVSRAVADPIATSIGKVPSPNAAIVAAPPASEPLVTEAAKAA
jgi:hypothetical protein